MVHIYKLQNLQQRQMTHQLPNLQQRQMTHQLLNLQNWQVDYLKMLWLIRKTKLADSATHIQFFLLLLPDIQSYNLLSLPDAQSCSQTCSIQ